MTRPVLLSIAIAVILRIWKKTPQPDVPEPEEEPEPEPEEEPEPEPKPPKGIYNTVKKSGIGGLKLRRRMGFKNRIHIENLSKFYDFKVKYRAQPILKGFGIKGCTVDFNPEHEWGEVTICRNYRETLEETTWACHIDVIRINPDGSEGPGTIYSGPANSSRNITIVDRVPRMARRTKRTNSCFSTVF